MSSSGEVNNPLITFQKLIQNINDSLILKKSKEYSIENEYKLTQIDENVIENYNNIQKVESCGKNMEIEKLYSSPVVSNLNTTLVKNAFKKKLLSKINFKEIDLSIFK
jgi:hypothetical protein